jgi:hypothetical protein
LPDYVDLGEGFEQKGQLVAGRLFIVDDDGVDGHRADEIV